MPNYGLSLVSHVSIEETATIWIQILPASSVNAWFWRTCVPGLQLVELRSF